MEKVEIIIQIEAERLKALDFFLFDKQKSSLKVELEKAAEGIYEKYVPEDTRRYIDSQTKPATGTKNRSKRTGNPIPKQASSLLEETEVESNAQP
ncbi:MAG: DUF6103 family protein [Faecousia sp.]